MMGLVFGFLLLLLCFLLSFFLLLLLFLGGGICKTQISGRPLPCLPLFTAHVYQPCPRFTTPSTTQVAMDVFCLAARPGTKRLLPRGGQGRVARDAPRQSTRWPWGVAGHPTRPAGHGHGSKLNHQGTAGFSPCFHLPGFRFGFTFWTHTLRLSDGERFDRFQGKPESKPSSGLFPFDHVRDVPGNWTESLRVIREPRKGSEARKYWEVLCTERLCQLEWRWHASEPRHCNGVSHERSVPHSISRAKVRLACLRCAKGSPNPPWVIITAISQTLAGPFS